MAITQVSTATSATSTNGTNVTVSAPGTLLEGDVILAFGTANESSGFTTVPSGFVSFADSASADTPNAFRTTAWYKVCGASEPADYTFGNTGAAASGVPLVVEMVAWRGVDNSDPVPHVSEIAGGANATEPANPATAFTQVDSGRLFYMRSARIASSAVPAFSSATANWTEIVDTGASNGSNNGFGMAVYISNFDTGAGSRSEPQLTCSVTETDNVYILGCLRALNSGTLDMGTLGSASMTFAGTRDTTIGDFAMPLGGATMDVVGDVMEPRGPMAMQLSPATQAFDGVSEVGGDFTMSLSPVSGDFAGQIVNGDFAMTLSPVTAVDFAGQIINGDFAIQLSPVTGSFAAQIVNGSFGMQLSPTTLAVAGAVVPTGDLSMDLPSISMLIALETVPFGENVIHVDAEKRGLRVERDDSAVTPVYLKDIHLPPIPSEIELTLQSVTSDFTGGTVVFADASLALSSVTSSLAGAVASLGDFSLALSPVTAALSGASEDLLKFTQTIGDGTTTSHTITHNLGTRDVIVGVYDATTYEEVLVSSITHTTTNTVTVVFPAAPATNSYRVVVLYSSI